MKISVIIPVYNGEKYIKETLDSIFEQTYRNFEVIVMDGASIDKTAEIVAQYPNVKFYSRKDKGQSDAINHGFKYATGDILAWQNADDVYFPYTFNEVVNFFKQNTNADLIYGYYHLIDEKSNWICDVKPILWNKWKFKHGRFCPVQPTVFWRKNVYESKGQLRLDLNYCMDVDFYASISKKFNICLLPKFLGKFRVHQESKTQNINNKKSIMQEYYQVLSQHFKYNKINRLLFYIFQKRADIASTIKRKWLKKL
ncbi:glycosyltransferase [Pontibacter qinzhouensis]|uniref:Glycosyltransferase n=1 Tax=Pontibacter qinzhouensis TaxID=2603253 RepID=A0A5C8K5K7_9BACT|nr:glycosyltransferase family 2 protein [Pontibacter qinzhouensis]TXK44904.1 glycosyltransferase [Pontibacter qinzhouensis]